MTNSEGSHASQREVVEGEVKQCKRRRLKMQADLEKDGSERMEDLMQRNDSPSEEEVRRLRVKKKESEIGVNDQGEEGDDQEEMRGNQDEPMEEAEEEQEEDELPMYQEHYNALFSMDFVETKHPHDDTMRDLGIFEDVELVLKNMQLGKFFSHRMESYKELTCEFLASMKHHEFDRLAWFIACSPNLSLDSPSKADKLTSFSSRPSVSRSFSTLTSALLRLKASATTLAFPGWY
ncbi:unnamed protein product [Microthlaspi erraticum]|uniref:Arabidopsis retrotransposon Orf1 C-terminal domain-containing protein n=1 Tax=Microthlaspi erraticum TaxID=1685480 RepID=A0A6D2IKM1_9BRAS|nr:unnamed protein product [Microthlaspi erraticum]